MTHLYPIVTQPFLSYQILSYTASLPIVQYPYPVKFNPVHF